MHPTVPSDSEARRGILQTPASGYSGPHLSMLKHGFLNAFLVVPRDAILVANALGTSMFFSVPQNPSPSCSRSNKR